MMRRNEYIKFGLVTVEFAFFLFLLKNALKCLLIKIIMPQAGVICFFSLARRTAITCLQALWYFYGADTHCLN